MSNYWVLTYFGNLYLLSRSHSIVQYGIIWPSAHVFYTPCFCIRDINFRHKIPPLIEMVPFLYCFHKHINPFTRKLWKNIEDNCYKSHVQPFLQTLCFYQKWCPIRQRMHQHKPFFKYKNNVLSGIIRSLRVLVTLLRLYCTFHCS